MTTNKMNALMTSSTHGTALGLAAIVMNAHTRHMEHTLQAARKIFVPDGDGGSSS